MTQSIKIRAKSKIVAERREWEEKQTFMRFFRRPAYKIGGKKLCM